HHPARVRYTVLLGSTVMMAAFAPVILVQPFLIKHEVATGLFGVYQAPLRLTAVIAAIFAPRVSAKAGAPRMFSAACVGMVLAFAGLSVFDNVSLFALFAVPALIQGFMRPTIDTYV